jgi:hypothetical protein
MDRHNRYETSFEAYLQAHRICYVAVQEGRRAYLGDSRVKNIDFIVHTPTGLGLLVDIKGRRYPNGSNGKAQRIWQNWSGQDDIDGLQRWQKIFGQGYHSLLVFNYCLGPNESAPEDWGDLWIWQGERYLFRAITIDDYCQEMRLRSIGWDTVHIPAASFRRDGRPFSFFTHQFQPVADEVPF